MNSKIHRCGYCGRPVNEDAEPLEGECFDKAVKILDEYGDYRTHQEHGEYCVYDEMMREEQRQWVQVTRDMASDVGDMNLEGQWVRW